MLSNEELQSRVISFLRFPLIVLVVFIHSNPWQQAVNGCGYAPDSINTTVYQAVYAACMSVISRIAVPLFFIFSGYLLFRNIEHYTARIYKQKITNRFRTLLIPYFFWISSCLFVSLLTQLAFGHAFHVDDSMTNWSIGKWLSAFWDGCYGGFPANVPFWYVRNLMVMILISPGVYFLIKKASYGLPLLAGAAWMLLEAGPPYQYETIFFFSVGAWFGIHKRLFITWPQRWVWITGVVWLLLSTLEISLMDYDSYLHRVNLLAGICFVLGLTARQVKSGRWSMPAILSASSFFIFAYHAIIIGKLERVLILLLHPDSCAAFLAIYFGQTIFLVVFGVGLYALLHRCLPRLTAWITGGR